MFCKSRRLISSIFENRKVRLECFLVQCTSERSSFGGKETELLALRYCHRDCYSRDNFGLEFHKFILKASCGGAHVDL